ncbi:MAG: SDR family oxidoreductase [Acidobacteriota bacterium]|nr:SDR family oxidoreductase [Acidobacteriota bacterium]
MRVLILGGGGMLGHRLALRFRDEFETWVTLRGSAHAYARYGLLDTDHVLPNVDVLNFDAVVGAIARVRPAAVINCIGIIKQLATAHDPILSLTVNSLLSHRLQQLCVACGSRLIHLSTDCVFNGRKGMYTEDDPSDAIDLYGRTKFLGETSGSGALTLRSSIIGRELVTTSGLVEWFLSQRGGRVEGYTRAIYSGFTTDEMARIIGTVLRDHPDLTGTWQVSSAPINKHDLLLLIRDAYGVQVKVEKSDRIRIDRSLDSTQFRARTGYLPPAWPEMIAEMAADAGRYETWRGATG